MATVNEWLDGKMMIADAAPSEPWHVYGYDTEDSPCITTKPRDEIERIIKGSKEYRTSVEFEVLGSSEWIRAEKETIDFIADARATVPRLIAALRLAVGYLDLNEIDDSQILAILEGRVQV